MMKNKKQRLSFILGLLIAIFGGILLFSFSDSVLAQANVQNGDVFGTASIDQNVALGKESLVVTAVRIINVGLGLLGIIALGIVLYGGFVYMTSGGSEDKIATAKKILVNGTIGLAIILSSWAITRFVLQKLAEATDAKGGVADSLPSQCQNAEFANNNPDICLGGNNIPGGDNQDCAVKNHNVLLVRGITPSTKSNEATGMNNAKVRVLFNNAVNGNDPKTVFSVMRIEGGNSVDISGSFDFRFANEDPALVEATFLGQNGLDQISQGEYTVQVNKNLKGGANQEFVEKVDCGEFPSQARFQVDTNGVIDNQKPLVGPVTLNGKVAAIDGEDLTRGRVHTITLSTTDNSGIGVIHFHVAVQRKGVQVSTFEYYDIPKVSRGSKATLENPFVAKLPLVIAANTELFDEYTVTIDTFDIDGNSTQSVLKGIVVGKDCGINKQGPECLNNNQACNNDLQCASKKCVNNQCVVWPVITDVRKFWDGAAGNYVTIQGNYFGERSGHVYFGYPKAGGAAGEMIWQEATSPACDARDLWHDEQIIVAVPDDAAIPVGTRAVIKVTKAPEVGQAEEYLDTTIDNHGPIPGPNAGYFIKNNTKRPGLCAVGVAAGNPNIPGGSNTAPANTELLALGTAFGPREQGKIQFGQVQGEVSGWSDNSIRTRVPQNMKAGRVDVSVDQNGVVSNEVSFFVGDVSLATGPVIASIDPSNTTRKSYITITGENFGSSVGAVYLAPNANTKCRENGKFNGDVCKQLDTETCGEGWSSTQIFAQIPGDIDFKSYTVIVERGGDLATSQGNNSITVADGPASPGICFFSPQSGPAPLPEGSSGLIFKGVNFSDTPKIYFSWRGSVPSDINTWLVSEGPAVRKDARNSNGVFTTVTSTIPVVNGVSLTPNSGATIRLKNAAGQLSNAVTYKVNDCSKSAPIDGYKCCLEGPDKGFFKPNNQICKGQTQEGGYAWRFTTGRIPEAPQVVESCVFPTPEGAEPVFPSPAPWVGWLGKDAACINQSVVVRIKVPSNGTLENINAGTVKVYSCVDKDGQPNCSGNNKTSVALQNNDLELSGDGYLTIVNNPMVGVSRFTPNTWYHIELSKNISSVRNVSVGGVMVVEREQLLSTRSCGNDTAYCFDFKTGTDSNRCELDKVGVVPNPFTVNYLGVLQLPGNLDLQHPWNPSASSTMYYKVWGAGNQNCSVLNVQGYGWRWDTSDVTKASTIRKPDNDTRSSVTALSNTVPGSVAIRATSSTSQGDKVGRADLTIDLSEPTIIDFWPNCTESCTEAELGVKFDRQMFQDSLSPENIKLYQCADELCDSPEDAEVPIDTADKDYTTYRFQPITLGGGPRPLQKATWYKVVVSTEVRAVGSLGIPPLEDRPGKKLKEEFSWRFRTTVDADGKCIADKVVVQPQSFVARQIGEKTKYNSFPRTAPNKCSKLGQTLNPWLYGWTWGVDSENPGVASVSDFESKGEAKSFCGLNCLPIGSDIPSEKSSGYPLCGNRTIDPGEDCDIGMTGANGEMVEVAGVSCSLNCLRPGNRNAGGDVNAPVCGNGIVNTAAGEECDPKNPDHGSFCSLTCTWKGSANQPAVTTSTPWCGSGTKTFGEDCDIANASTTIPDGVFGCSKQCLHIGTSLSQNWCTTNRNIRVGNQNVIDTSECKQALSICGNGTLELGEECEYFTEGNETGVYVSLNAETGEKVRAVTASKNVCTNRCVLKNICDLNQIPLQVAGQAGSGPRCVKGSEGCTEGCMVSGSSVGYSQPSFCGNGKVEKGEYPMCENVEALEGAALGQNPVQIVTAVGLGSVNEKTRSQDTKITAGISKVTGDDGTPKVPSLRPSGSGDYSLQCGYTEQVDVAPNLLQNLNGNFEANTTGWLLEIPNQSFRDRTQMTPTRDGAAEGQTSLHVVGDAYIYHSNVPVQPNTNYIISFQYKITAGTIFAYGYKQAPHIPVDLGAALGELNGIRVTGPNRNWATYTRSVVTPADVSGYGITLDISSPDNVAPADVLIDNIKVSPVLRVDTHNDCPGTNTDNRFGVASNSCCYVRPTRVDSYPANQSENVCLNTAISVSFDSFIDKTSLDNNIVLVSGHGSNYTCPAGELLMTEQVKTLLAFNGVSEQKTGIWQKVWGGVKHFFVRIFGIGEAHAVRENLVTWCGSTNLTNQVSYETSNDLKNVTTTVSVYLGSALLPNTQYGIILSGGNGGIKSIEGVGIRNPVKTENVYGQMDFIEFETGDKLCKIDHIEVTPESGLFTAPNTTSTFRSKVISTTSQRIQPIPSVYSWDYHWVPENNAIFSIPASNTPGNEESVVVAAKNVEGTITAAALAQVTTDVTPGANQQGMVFSAPFTLQASFCENPWPPRDYFPYEDGVSFGSHRNRDGVDANKNFNGSELAGVRIGGGLLAGNGTDSYFNVSFSYCADANLSGSKEDDLPYLKPLVFGNTVEGQCSRPVGGNIPGLLPGLPANNQPQRCTLDIQCQSSNVFSLCENKSVKKDETLAPGVLKKILFVNDKNDDAIGLQISQNPQRLSAQEWYRSQFPGADTASLRDVKIDGYDALTDGKSYYVNALNQNGGPSTAVYNNIYIFSINGNAQTDTQKVFGKLMSSLKFNINISDLGYCLSKQEGVNDTRQTLEENFSRLTQITSQSCRSDFDCRAADGAPLQGTNGVCSNAKTKLLRDWQRLQNIQSTQEKLESYKNSADGAGKYPDIQSGSFIPGYTNSHWSVSWGNLANKIGGLPLDPLNTWTTCGDLDPQTCWNATNSTVQCPFLSSVLEYDHTEDGNTYFLHSPLEYFNLNEPLNPVIKEFIPDVSKFRTDRWCVSGELIQASAGECGNGIVNLDSGEDCDPPQTVQRSNTGIVGGKPGICLITGNKCQKSAEDCGYTVDLEKLQVQGARPGLLQALLDSNSYCSSSNNSKDAVIDSSNLVKKNGIEYVKLFSCEADSDCQDLNTYKKAQQFSFVNTSLVVANQRITGTYAQFEQFFKTSPQRFQCISLNTPFGTSAQNPKVVQPCMGAVAGDGIGQCPFGQDASKLCTDQCRYSYGSCQVQGVCGNGRVEAGERCDDGALNGTYGHCSDGRTPSTGAANQPVAACQGLRGDYCGNGIKEGNNEFCEYLPDITLPYHGGPGEAPARVSLASFLSVMDQDPILTCTDLNKDICSAFIINLKNRVETTPEILNKRCSLDKSILCSEDSDCQNLPGAETTIDLLRDGTDRNRLLQPAIVGRSNYGTCVLPPAYTLGTNYSQLKNLSCAGSCQAIGKYCGDGSVDGPYEQCDDKNNVDGDGCNKYCRNEVAQVVARDQAPEISPLCGNGTVDSGESCDLGSDQNGKACTPQYGRSCSYCSSDCRNVLTVDPAAFCGDNILQQPGEQCDVIDGVVTVPTTTVRNTKTVALNCPTNYKGQYSCNQCNQFSNTCVQCGQLSRIAGGVTPRVAFLFPLSSTPSERRKWANENNFGLYVKRDSFNGATLIIGEQADALGQFYLFSLSKLGIANSTAPQSILDADQGINTNNLCVNEYSIAFNQQGLNAIDANAPQEDCDDIVCNQQARDIGKYIMQDVEDYFPFSLTNTGNSVDNEVVVSPAIPQDYFRVVVRFTNTSTDGVAYEFHGVLVNNAFPDDQRFLSDFGMAGASLSATVGLNNEKYWMPTGPSFQNGVFIHPLVSGPKTSIQAMTIKPTGNGNMRKSYAFLVEAVSTGGLVPIGSITDREVTVDVYVGHNAQNPTYSIYKPKYSFKLSGAGGSNQQALYWHVFNLTNDILSNQYQLTFPSQVVNGGLGEPFRQGKLAADIPDVMCYMSGSEFCNREVNP